jgi:hypothetical protein
VIDRRASGSGAQFAILRVAQTRSLNLANWHHFLGALTLAGYRHEGMIWANVFALFGFEAWGAVALLSIDCV